MDFNGKLVLITGGSSGIGLAAAEELARRGAHLCLVARGADRLETARQAVTAARRDPSQKVSVLACDVSSAAQVSTVLTGWLAQNGTPDLVINSAGIAFAGFFEQTPVEAFLQQMQVNYMGIVHVCKAVVPGMIARRAGYIANISSAAGYIGVLGYSAYGGSKFAVRGLTDVLRAELKRYGLRFSVVYPADVDTPQLKEERGMMPEEMKIINGAAGKPKPPAVVAREIVDGIARGQYQIFPGIETKLYYTLMRIIGPNLFNGVLDMIYADGVKKAAARK